MTHETSKDTTPLCVDLDGTLIQTDLSLESTLKAIKAKPWILLFFPFWLKIGMAYFKHQISQWATMDVAYLPWNQEVLDYILAEKQKGRPLILVTGSIEAYAQQVADHLGCFDKVLATTSHYNLTGRNKAKKLCQVYGKGAFDYIGNEPKKDQHVWQVSRYALFANADSKQLSNLASTGEITFYKTFESQAFKFTTILKAIRVHQWVKNILVFIPLITTHNLLNPNPIFQSILAFFAFSFTASATYLINDLFDLEADRKHPNKKNRPFAAGTLPIIKGTYFIAGLGLLGLAIMACLPALFSLTVCTYLAITLSYSLWLKRLAIVDVITLASLYTLRVMGGAFAVDVALSFWLLAFSMFLFQGLAIMKRVSELMQVEQQNQKAAHGRGYTIEDRAILTQFGTTSGYLAVFVLAFYINSDDVRTLYQQPEALWLLCPIFLYWTTRIWLKTARGNMNDDPIVFALKDPVSLLLGLVSATIILIATINS